MLMYSPVCDGPGGNPLIIIWKAQGVPQLNKHLEEEETSPNRFSWLKSSFQCTKNCSLFHHSVLVDLSVSMMMHNDRVSEPLC